MFAQSLHDPLGTCESMQEEVICQTFGTRANIYEEGDVDSELLRSRLVEGLDLFSTLVTDQMGVLDTSVTEIELLNDGSGSGVIGGDDNSTGGTERVDATVVVGAVAAGLAVFLLTMIWMVFSQRRQSARALAHSRFEEEWDGSEEYEEPYRSRSVAPQPPLISPDSGLYKDDEEDQSYPYEASRYQTRVIMLEQNEEENVTAIHANQSFQEWTLSSPIIIVPTSTSSWSLAIFLT